ncbi:unnamed protein product, partial [Chrysoparadoxa australica]
RTVYSTPTAVHITASVEASTSSLPFKAFFHCGHRRNTGDERAIVILHICPALHLQCKRRQAYEKGNYIEREVLQPDALLLPLCPLQARAKVKCQVDSLQLEAYSEAISELKGKQKKELLKRVDEIFQAKQKVVDRELQANSKIDPLNKWENGSVVRSMALTAFVLMAMLAVYAFRDMLWPERYQPRKVRRKRE